MKLVKSHLVSLIKEAISEYQRFNLVKTKLTRLASKIPQPQPKNKEQHLKYARCMNKLGDMRNLINDPNKFSSEANIEDLETIIDAQVSAFEFDCIDNFYGIRESQFTEKGHWGKEGSGLLLTTGEKVLLLLRSRHVTEPHTWGIPGGAIEEGEDPLESALREAEEEMGLSINSYRVIGNTIYKDEEDGFKYTTYILRVVEEMEEEPIKLNWENTKYKWVDQDWLEDNAHLLHSGVQYTLFSEGKWKSIFDSDYL